MVQIFDLGDVLPLTVEVRDASGNLANAGAVTLTIGLPDGTAVTPAVTNPSVGRYQVDYATTQVGRHTVRWVATGQNASAYTDSFDVRAADPGYILSLSAAKAALNMGTATVDDEELRSLVEAVTWIVENHKGEVVAKRTFTEHVSIPSHGEVSRWNGEYRLVGYPPGNPTRQLVLDHVPLVSVASIVRPFDGTTWTSADIVIVDPNAGLVATYGAPFWGGLTATYVAGWPVIPANYTEAAKIILRHLWQTQQAPTLGPPSPFSEEANISSTGMGFAIPNRAVELLGGRQPVIG